jgi:hypothetical protein
MMVIIRSTIGGTITQNFVQNGIFIPPFVVRISIEKKLKEINKKWLVLSESEIIDAVEKCQKNILLLAFVPI